MTPRAFASQYGIDPKKLRAYLRRRWPNHRKHDSWFLTPEMVGDACQHFGLPHPSARPAELVAEAQAPVILEMRPTPIKAVSPRGQRRAGQNGLHHVLERQAAEEGIELRPGTRYAWLTNRGHLEPALHDRLPPDVLTALDSIFRQLGGDAAALRAKNPRPLEPDLVHTGTGLLIEVDEIQHFTTAREATINQYPQDLVVGFDPKMLVRAVRTHGRTADRAFRHKVVTEFPGEGGRNRQRAYFDAVRDLIVPAITGMPVLRVLEPNSELGLGDHAMATLRSAVTWAECKGHP